MTLNPLTQQLLIILLGAMLALPGIYAMYRGMHKDLEEERIELQINALANEVQRLQVLTDDQAREISRLKVETATLRATQKALLESSKRLSQQVQQMGAVPVVDVDGLGGLLP